MREPYSVATCSGVSRPSDPAQVESFQLGAYRLSAAYLVPGTRSGIIDSSSNGWRRNLHRSRGFAGSSVQNTFDRVGRGLQVEQFGVLTTKGHQFVVAAMFCHSAVIKNIDPVRGPYGGEAM